MGEATDQTPLADDDGRTRCFGCGGAVCVCDDDPPDCEPCDGCGGRAVPGSRWCPVCEELGGEG